MANAVKRRCIKLRDKKKKWIVSFSFAKREGVRTKIQYSLFENFWAGGAVILVNIARYSLFQHGFGRKKTFSKTSPLRR